MNNYKFNIDQELTLWQRISVKIEANNYEEAEKILKQKYTNWDIEDIFIDCELLEETKNYTNKEEVTNEIGNIIIINN